MRYSIFTLIFTHFNLDLNNRSRINKKTKRKFPQLENVNYIAKESFLDSNPALITEEDIKKAETLYFRYQCILTKLQFIGLEVPEEEKNEFKELLKQVKNTNVRKEINDEMQKQRDDFQMLFENGLDNDLLVRRNQFFQQQDEDELSDQQDQLGLGALRIQNEWYERQTQQEKNDKIEKQNVDFWDLDDIEL